jgi:hypothetical protein
MHPGRGGIGKQQLPPASRNSYESAATRVLAQAFWSGRCFAGTASHGMELAEASAGA